MLAKKAMVVESNSSGDQVHQVGGQDTACLSQVQISPYGATEAASYSGTSSFHQLFRHLFRVDATDA